ncbi:MAG: monovalent cation/H+ antiporter complex subunit F [Desulfurococcaceae archaeon]|uniref:pH regulation protein F n=1 Tax=Staphylothermus marinus TaxID=2280 RepID=A0A7C4HBP1_STAMA
MSLLENIFMNAVLILMPIYLTSFVIYVIRAVKGPTISDVVLAIDCLSYDLAVFLAVLSIYFKSVFLVSSAIMLALWAYLLDIYIAKHLVSKEVGA